MVEKLEFNSGNWFEKAQKEKIIEKIATEVPANTRSCLGRIAISTHVARRYSCGRSFGRWVRFPPPPPNILPSIDKKDFIGGWFLYYLRSRYLSRSCVLAERLSLFAAWYFGDAKI